MFIKLVRLGRDAELRYTAQGKAVCTLACAFDVGYGEKKRTQWIEGALWEKRAEALHPHLLKGKQIHVVFDDLNVEIFEGKNGFGAKLKGRIVDVQLAGGASEAQSLPQAAKQPPRLVPQNQAVTPTGNSKSHPDYFDDSEIPF